MPDLLLSTTVFASFVGGVLALLAPCCASVMLPAYFASSFRRRSQLLLMTVVFAAGVGTVILPIALGASALSRLLNEQHAIVFTIGGSAMILAGLAMLSGRWLAVLLVFSNHWPASLLSPVLRRLSLRRWLSGSPTSSAWSRP